MCGIVGIWGHPEASNLAYLGLHALQHRGQEGAGIVSSDGERLFEHKGRGLVADVFGDRTCLEAISGNRAIGHVRYSTTGQSAEVNVQPLKVQYKAGGLAIAHNGNFINSSSLRASLEEEGALFQSTTDTEAVVHLLEVVNIQQNQAQFMLVTQRPIPLGFQFLIKPAPVGDVSQAIGQTDGPQLLVCLLQLLG